MKSVLWTSRQNYSSWITLWHPDSGHFVVFADVTWILSFFVGHVRLSFPCRSCPCASKFTEVRPSIRLVEQVVARMVSIWPPKRPISLCLARKRPFWFVSCCNPSCDLLWILWYFFGSLLSSHSSSDQIALHLRIGPLSWPGVRFWSPMPPRAQHGIDPKESDPGRLRLARHLCIWHKVQKYNCSVQAIISNWRSQRMWCIDVVSDALPEVGRKLIVWRKTLAHYNWTLY